MSTQWLIKQEQPIFAGQLRELKAKSELFIGQKSSSSCTVTSTGHGGCNVEQRQSFNSVLMPTHWTEFELGHWPCYFIYASSKNTSIFTSTIFTTVITTSFKIDTAFSIYKQFCDWWDSFIPNLESAWCTIQCFVKIICFDLAIWNNVIVALFLTFLCLFYNPPNWPSRHTSCFIDCLCFDAIHLRISVQTLH
jgi:hypothetical protein